MVYPRFLVSSRPFEGSLESTFSMKQVRCCTLFTDLAPCSLNWKNGRHELK